MAYLYILGLKDGTHYCGITSKLVKRIIQHQSGKSKSTKYKLPLVIKYLREFPDMKTARMLEKRIKSQGVTRYWNKLNFTRDNGNVLHHYTAALAKPRLACVVLLSCCLRNQTFCS